ncbi:sigma-70 family RNA polymerase sigma factor [Oscillospiraceae bacterium OttesenSCG-928-F05]|nr:sigma-70 family RNA polymerase sigma factor [Oscillospiraceae bacterium OttesenSCG-928-F05]
MRGRVTFIDGTDDAAIYRKRGAMARDRLSSKERERLRRLLADTICHQLTDRQREILLMHYGEGRKLKDIAELWGVNPSVVTRHLQRAYGKIRRRVGGA